MELISQPQSDIKRWQMSSFVLDFRPFFIAIEQGSLSVGAVCDGCAYDSCDQ